MFLERRFIIEISHVNLDINHEIYKKHLFGELMIHNKIYNIT